MGVLDRIWEGQYARGPDGTQIPVDRPAALSDVEDPEAWWEIPSQGALARKIRRYYLLLRPVVDGEGRLVEAGPLGRRRPPAGATGKPARCGPWA